MERKIPRISPIFAKGNSRLAASRTCCGPSQRATPTATATSCSIPLTGHFPSIAMQTLPPPLCPNKEEFGVCVGRQTFTHRKLLPVENEGEMWWFNAARSGKQGIFFPRQGRAFAGGVRPWVLGRGKTLAVIPPPAESRLAPGGSPPVCRREGKSKSGDLRSQIKGDVGVILNFFTRILRNALPPPPPLGLFLNRDHLWLIVHIV